MMRDPKVRAVGLSALRTADAQTRRFACLSDEAHLFWLVFGLERRTETAAGVWVVVFPATPLI